MIVFKAFLKILNKNKFIVILYTVILFSVAMINMNSNNKNTNFVASKPDVLIVNYDENKGITKGLIKYITDKSNIINLKNNEEAINDALFYRDINYVIYIPKDYNKNFMEGKNPKIDVKTSGDYLSSLAERSLSNYIKLANIYLKSTKNEDEIVSKVNESLLKECETQIVSKLDTDKLTKATFYYNFLNYNILACSIYVICIVLSSFNDLKIRRRIIISSINYKKFNRELILSTILYSFIIWSIYVLLSIYLAGKIMFSNQGMIYILNSFIFTICATTIAMLIGNIILNKNIVSPIVNVIALGSSFLCGSFIPMQFLSKGVIKIAHILHSYYYIKTNEILKTLEIFSFNEIKPILINMLIMLVFSIIFIILTNIISKNK